MNKLLLLLITFICFGCAADKSESQLIDDESINYLTAGLKDNIKNKNQYEQDSITLNLSITNQEIFKKEDANIILLETVTEDGRFYQSIIGIKDSANAGFPTYSFSNTGQQRIKINKIADLGKRLQITGTAEFKDNSSDFDLYFDKSFDGSKDPWELEIK
jgi:hypothetical protein